MTRIFTILCLVLTIVALSCSKKNEFKPDPGWRYFEVGIRNANPDDCRNPKPSYGIDYENDRLPGKRFPA